MIPAEIWIIIGVALAFDFINGFHDAANTIGKGVVDPAIVTPAVILAGLAGAIIWNLMTWWWGLPSSSSHALVGGYDGAALAKAGPSAVIASGVTKVAWFIVLSPLIGMVIGFLVMWLVTWLNQRSTPARVDRLFRRLKLVSAAS